MVKTKYERMNKQEKKELLERYKKTEKGKNMMMRLLRLNFIGILGILYSVFLFITDFKNLTWKTYLMAIPLLLASCFFLFMSFRLKKKVLTQFAVKKI